MTNNTFDWPHRMNGAEEQSQRTRVDWAEGLILQLPKDHDGRNSWLLNYGRGIEAQNLRVDYALSFDVQTQSAVNPGKF